MSLIFLVLIGLFLFGKYIYDVLTTNKKAFSKEELEQMHGQVIGKSRTTPIRSRAKRQMLRS